MELVTDQNVFEAEQRTLLKPSTAAFIEQRCAENKARMEREAKGDYGQPICIYFGEFTEEKKARLEKAILHFYG